MQTRYLKTARNARFSLFTTVGMFICALDNFRSAGEYEELGQGEKGDLFMVSGSKILAKLS